MTAKKKKRKTKKTKQRKAAKRQTQNSGYKTHQLTIFIGQQSYAYRTDSLAEIQKYTGLKEITAETITARLSQINDKLFGKTATVAEPELSMVEIQQPDYVAQLKARLIAMGAKSEKKQIALLRKKTGTAVKTFEGMFPVTAQALLLTLLRGKK